MEVNHIIPTELVGAEEPAQQAQDDDVSLPTLREVLRLCENLVAARVGEVNDGVKRRLFTSTTLLGIFLALAAMLKMIGFIIFRIDSKSWIFTKSVNSV